MASNPDIAGQQLLEKLRAAAIDDEIQVLDVLSRHLPADTDMTGRQMLDELFMVAETPDETGALAQVAVRAGFVWHCAKFRRLTACGYVNDIDAATCTACGAPRPEPGGNR